MKGVRRGGVLGVILVTLLAGGCATTTARPYPFPRPGSKPDTLEPAPGELSRGPQIVEAALSLLGAPYGPGASGPDRFDCSGLVQFVFSRFDIALPRTVSQQFSVTTPIPAATARAGDLLFFTISGEAPSHVGIAMGDGRFVHAPSSRGVVRVESLSAPYWRERLDSARRVEQRDGSHGSSNEGSREDSNEGSG